MAAVLGLKVWQGNVCWVIKDVRDITILIIVVKLSSIEPCNVNVFPINALWYVEEQ